MQRFALLLAGIFLAGCGAKKADNPNANGALRVAAAADLAKAFTEIGAEYERGTGFKVVFSFGASGQLTQQIEQGAPFDVFAAANEAYIDKLAKENKVKAATKQVYAIGQLVLWTRKGMASPPKSLQGLTAPRFAHIALANPEHAPYGKAAQEALQSAKLWETLKPKLVYGENVQQAFQFAQSGNADAALTSYALTMGADGDTLPIPQSLYKPLRQAMALVSSSDFPEGANEFMAYVQGSSGRAILQKYGFTLP